MTKQLPSHSYVLCAIQSDDETSLMSDIRCWLFIWDEITFDDVVCHKRKQTYHIKKPESSFTSLNKDQSESH